MEAFETCDRNLHIRVARKAHAGMQFVRRFCVACAVVLSHDDRHLTAIASLLQPKNEIRCLPLEMQMNQNGYLKLSTWPKRTLNRRGRGLETSQST